LNIKNKKLERSFPKLTPPSELDSLSQGFKTSVGTEEIPIKHGVGRILAKDITSPEELPNFHRSLMDGFAVRSKDTSEAIDINPVYLKVAGKISIGKPFPNSLKEKEAIEISTGAELPKGADAVIKLEDCNLLTPKVVEIKKPVPVGQYITKRGDELSKGSILGTKGQRINIPLASTFAAVGINNVPVYKKAKVQVIPTGDELVSYLESPPQGKIRDINSLSLSLQIEKIGAICKTWPILKDDHQLLIETTKKALKDSDMVIISGGSSIGREDYTLKVIEKLKGTKILTRGIAIRPGKPTIIAKTTDNKPIIGLPGHPVSSILAFELVAKPILKRISGEKIKEDYCTTLAIASCNIASTFGIEEYIRVQLKRKENKLYAIPLPGGSSAIFSLAKADGLLKIPLNKNGISKGETGEVILLKD
jgi:molybdopterin molybdotransferase